MTPPVELQAAYAAIASQSLALSLDAVKADAALAALKFEPALTLSQITQRASLAYHLASAADAAMRLAAIARLTPAAPASVEKQEEL